jgi:hypothetical protein
LSHYAYLVIFPTLACHSKITASYSFGTFDVLQAFYKVLNVILTFEKTKAAEIIEVKRKLIFEKVIFSSYAVAKMKTVLISH